MAYETIKLELNNSIGLVTLNRPDRLNALTLEMAAEFSAAVRAAQEAGARVIVVTGAGRAFSAGGDLNQMQEIAAKQGKVEAFFDEPLKLLHDAIMMIRRTPLPFIAAVNGVAFGAGCNLALACDLVVAASSAKFSQAFVKIGLSPDCGGTYILPRLIGWKRAAYLLFTGDPIDAHEALEIGMVNSVEPDDELMTSSLLLAEKLAKGATASMAQTKLLLDASGANDYETQLELERRAQIESGQTRDFKEGVAAFLERRPAQFEGG
jgi:2-(1,2-epoxy-1,2-dihydrophenyl)acetyl-CoA isomerase